MACVKKMKLENEDAALMLRVRDGDDSALECLYDRYGSLLYSLALRLVSDTGAAEEILQDVFLQLWRKASEFDPAGSLAGWLIVSTRRRAISHLRRTSNRLCFGLLHDSADFLAHATLPVELRQKEAAQEYVSIALAALSAAQLDVITLAYFEGMTCEEISVRTRAPLGTVKTRLRSALQSMRKSLVTCGLAAPGDWSKRGTNLEDVLITHQLRTRPPRHRSPQQESESLRFLARVVATSPAELLNSFLQVPISVCSAGTAGLSMLETNPGGGQVFRWTNLAGKLEKYTGGTTPRGFSPCGVTMDRDSPQLFSYPGRYFQYFNEVATPIVEGLVVPFYVGGEMKGTVWIVSHEATCRFDSEDARIMTTLAEFTGAAFHLIQSQRRSLTA